MFGCLTRSAYFDSRRKRARISLFCARSGGRTFSAARRDWPFSSSASQTTPMPPSPSRDSRRKPPTTSPMLNVPATQDSYHRRKQELEVERVERRDHIRVEVLGALAPDLRRRAIRLPGLGVRARVRERVEVVGHDHDPAAHRNLVLDLAVGVAAAVP